MHVIDKFTGSGCSFHDEARSAWEAIFFIIFRLYLPMRILSSGDGKQGVPKRGLAVVTPVNFRWLGVLSSFSLSSSDTFRFGLGALCQGGKDGVT